jgi:hypothetical protein
MPKSNLVAGDMASEPMADPRSWSNSPGTHIAGRAYLDEADQTAAEMEAKWGADRLRLLVGPELREKFDRQRYLLNQAIWHGELESVRRESMRMVNAWLALDKAAVAAGKAKLDPQVWEIAVGSVDAGNDYVAAIVPDNHHAHRVVAEGRKVVVFTLEEIGRLLAAIPSIAKTKQAFPGAAVTAVRRSVDDPLLAIDDVSRPLDENALGF